MRSIWTILTLVAVVAFLYVPAMGQVTGTLYQQEGTTADGYSAIDATGKAPTGTDGSTGNWKYQTGAGSWTGVYAANGWDGNTSTGDSKINIECDIEMFYTESFSNNKIYFHIGNPLTATSADKTAIVNGTFTANNGMYIGISFDATTKTADDMLKDVAGKYTGEVKDAMVGTIDVLNRPISDQSFNAKFSLDWSNDGGTTWVGPQAPVTFGTGASGTILNTLWWLVNSGQKGTYLLKYNVEMLPPVDQADGNYKFDPAIVAAPVL